MGAATFRRMAARRAQSFGGPLMFSRSDLHKVLDLIDRRSSADRTLLVAIDGLGGAGKSTLAVELSAELPAASIVEVDHFYRPMTDAERKKLSPREGYEDYFDWKRMFDEVLEPLSEQRLSRYRRYDWSTNSLAEWRETRPAGAVIIEGVYSTRPEFRPLLGVTVYVNAPREQRLARMIARRYENMEWLEHWMAAEDWYIENVRPADHADLVVDGSLPPLPEGED